MRVSNTALFSVLAPSESNESSELDKGVLVQGRDRLLTALMDEREGVYDLLAFAESFFVSHTHA